MDVSSSTTSTRGPIRPMLTATIRCAASSRRALIAASGVHTALPPALSGPAVDARPRNTSSPAGPVAGSGPRTTRSGPRGPRCPEHEGVVVADRPATGHRRGSGRPRTPPRSGRSLAELELPVAGAAARASPDHVTVLRQRRHGRPAISSAPSTTVAIIARTPSFPPPLPGRAGSGAAVLQRCDAPLKRAERGGQGSDKSRREGGLPAVVLGAPRPPSRIKRKCPARRVRDEPTLRLVRDLGARLASLPAPRPRFLSDQGTRTV